MAVYYLLLAVILGGGWYLCERRKSSRAVILYLVVVGAVLTAIATLRYSIGFDYFSYQSIFEKASAAAWGQLPTMYRSYLGYAVLNKIVGVLGGGYRTLLLLCNVFMTAAVFWVIWKYSKMPWISVFVYVSLQFFAHSMNLFRQSIAASILFLGYRFLRDRRLLPYVLVVLAAALFHYSAIVMIPVYFLLHMKSDWKHMAAVGILSLFCYLFSEPILQLVTSVILKNYAHYQDSIYWGGNGIHYVVIPAVYFGLTLIFRNKLLARDPRNNVLINSAYFTFILYMFMTKHFILERFSIYVFPLAMLLIPEILDTFQVETAPGAGGGKLSKEARQAKIQMKSQKFYRNWAIWTTVFLCLVYFGFAAARGYHKVYPYVSIFNQEEAVDNNEYLQGAR